MEKKTTTTKTERERGREIEIVCACARACDLSIHPSIACFIPPLRRARRAALQTPHPSRPALSLGPSPVSPFSLLTAVSCSDHHVTPVPFNRPAGHSATAVTDRRKPKPHRGRFTTSFTVLVLAFYTWCYGPNSKH